MLYNVDVGASWGNAHKLHHLNGMCMVNWFRLSCRRVRGSCIHDILMFKSALSEIKIL